MPRSPSGGLSMMTASTARERFLEVTITLAWRLTCLVRVGVASWDLAAVLADVPACGWPAVLEPGGRRGPGLCGARPRRSGRAGCRPAGPAVPAGTVPAAISAQSAESMTDRRTSPNKVAMACRVLHAVSRSVSRKSSPTNSKGSFARPGDRVGQAVAKVQPGLVPSLAEPEIGINSFPPVPVAERDFLDAELIEQPDDKITRVPAQPCRQHDPGLGDGRGADARRRRASQLGDEFLVPGFGKGDGDQCRGIDDTRPPACSQGSRPLRSC